MSTIYYCKRCGMNLNARMRVMVSPSYDAGDEYYTCGERGFRDHDIASRRGNTRWDNFVRWFIAALRLV